MVGSGARPDAAPPLPRRVPHVRGEPGAKSFVDDLILGRGFVRSRAAPSLRSIESQPSTQAFVGAAAAAARRGPGPGPGVRLPSLPSVRPSVRPSFVPLRSGPSSSAAGARGGEGRRGAAPRARAGAGPSSAGSFSRPQISPPARARARAGGGGRFFFSGSPGGRPGGRGGSGRGGRGARSSRWCRSAAGPRVDLSAGDFLSLTVSRVAGAAGRPVGRRPRPSAPPPLRPSAPPPLRPPHPPPQFIYLLFIFIFP